MAAGDGRGPHGFGFGVAVAVVGGVLTLWFAGILHLPAGATSRETVQNVGDAAPSVTSGTVATPAVPANAASGTAIHRSTTGVDRPSTTEVRRSPSTTQPPPPPPAKVDLVVNLSLTSNLPGNSIRVLQGYGGQSVGLDAAVYGADGQLSYSECSIAWTETVDGQLSRRGKSYCTSGGITQFGVDNTKIGTHVIVAAATDVSGETGSGTITVYVTP
jgi:hypothetical protein